MYYNPTLTLSDLENRLIEMDKELYLYCLLNNIKNKRIDVYIAGSSSLILNKVNVKATVDIDILYLSEIISNQLLEKYDMNTHITSMLAFIPYNWEDRAIPVDLNTRIINYWIISLEDSVICKIAADRPKDRNHLKASNLYERIDWKLLKEIALEMESNMLSKSSFEWFLYRYNEFVRSHNHEEIIIKNI